MKLKNVLIIAFLILTLIPFAIVSFLLYQSGFDLSKESYTRNLTESINVQSDYISQTIENNMISDYRFANRNANALFGKSEDANKQKLDLLSALQPYLESSEDKIAVSLLLDQDDATLYTIGEKTTLDTIMNQLPSISDLSGQTIVEFDLGKGTYSLGIITPVRDSHDVYLGSLISVYDKSYVFKIISSYYKISDTSTYICRANGDIISYRGLTNERKNANVNQALIELTFTSEGPIDMRVGTDLVSGYYKNIANTSWYLAGFIDDKLIYSFTTQYVLVYILIVVGVLIADLILAFYFSHKVVVPINGLIKMMDGYQNSLQYATLHPDEKSGYYETRYLQAKFYDLMKTIFLAQHNFEGIYQLYQSNDMGDINIDIDVKKQVASSNKKDFQSYMDELKIPEGACIVERFTRCFCEKDQQLLMSMFENMRDEHLSVTKETEIYAPDMNQKWFHTLVVPMYEDDSLSRLFIQLRDISSLKEQEIKSTEQARRDILTGLYNRSGLAEAANKAIQEGNRSDMHGLLFLDMNFFKMVNDNFGHAEGDDLLCSVAQTLLDTLVPDEIASRFGGDEFAVFLPYTSMERTKQVEEELKKRLIYPYQTEDISFVVSASIGVSCWDHSHPSTLEELLQQADASMYKAKREFKQGQAT